MNTAEILSVLWNYTARFSGMLLRNFHNSFNMNGMRGETECNIKASAKRKKTLRIVHLKLYIISMFWKYLDNTVFWQNLRQWRANLLNCRAHSNYLAMAYVQIEIVPDKYCCDVTKTINDTRKCRAKVRFIRYLKKLIGINVFCTELGRMSYKITLILNHT